MTQTEPTTTRGWWWPVVADLGCVLALAVGGKGAHGAGDSAWVLLTIGWPFAVSAGLAHVWLNRQRRQLGRVSPEGVVVLATTYLLGMLLRAVTGRGLAPAFLIVAGLFLACTMLGWRGVVHLVMRSRASRSRQG